MYSLVDLILLKDRSISRSDADKILSLATEIIKEKIVEGSSVLWGGLCTFTWKKKAATKKQAARWKEYPYEADGEKVRCVPEEGLDELEAKGQLMRTKKVVDGSPS